MPFNIGGDGNYGGPSNVAETLRMHRWAVTQLGPINIDNLKMLKDLQLPDFEAQIQEIQGAQLAYKYIKGVKWGDVQVTFYDDGSLLDELIEWKSTIYSAGRGIQKHNPGFGYKQDCTFLLLNGCREVENKLVLKNAFPKSIQNGKLSYTDTSIKVVSVTLAYDWSEWSGRNVSDPEG